MRDTSPHPTHRHRTQRQTPDWSTVGASRSCACSHKGPARLQRIMAPLPRHLRAIGTRGGAFEAVRTTGVASGHPRTIALRSVCFRCCRSGPPCDAQPILPGARVADTGDGPWRNKQKSPSARGWRPSPRPWRRACGGKSEPNHAGDRRCNQDHPCHMGRHPRPNVLRQPDGRSRCRQRRTAGDRDD